MTGSSPYPDSWTQSELSDDDWSALSRAYARMSPEQLLSHLTGINAQLQAQNRSMISRTLEDVVSDLDRPVPRRQATVDPYQPPDRGHPPSQSQTRSPSALDLLASHERIGPRLATKLMKASAKAQRG